jgi:hypothetical protein
MAHRSQDFIATGPVTANKAEALGVNIFYINIYSNKKATIEWYPITDAARRRRG